MRIFLDANVLFSAAKSAGAVRELLAKLFEADHVLCVDGYVVAEARRNLESKVAEAVAVLDALLEHVELAPFMHSELPSDTVAVLPEKDRPVLAAAIRLKCEALVSGDRTHFGSLYSRTVHGVVIHSLRSLAERLL